MALLAQTGDPTGDVAAAVTLATQIGLSAVFLWQWRAERQERRDLQATMLTFMERFGPALQDSTTTLERVQAGMATVIDNVPDHRQLDLSMRRLELTADELGSLLRTTRRQEEDERGT